MSALDQIMELYGEGLHIPAPPPPPPPSVLPSSPAHGSLEPPVEQSPSKTLEEDIVTPGVLPSSPARGSLDPPV
eukprot:CAMPEP_0174347310 /NCGR_PEP_ID=MMETSP0811_2-20130205/3318_1 /TAXON_ID=73025 ORGANISM="Eutreptiella gymnastica-like, Strain CCMP1594" /NCGR_SAMPLE_ID=MMETSP0811_2 /ASSEMBLY_ACC=CAM_ASM_000667 /LENGTH=73 /DNA_ID=CAMNT_0015472693 /DNA_START=44 /DNA_END=262 /DNA_ORIENTATION=+